jgi:hypothetical protein
LKKKRLKTILTVFIQNYTCETATRRLLYAPAGAINGNCEIRPPRKLNLGLWAVSFQAAK